MKNNAELKATLNMVLARLDSEPETAAEWNTINDALAAACAYAEEVQDTLQNLEESRDDK